MIIVTLGMMQYFCYPRDDTSLDLVPVDVCSSMMCAVAWKTATSPPSTETIPVYNCTSTVADKGTMALEKIFSAVGQSLKRNPFEGSMWYPVMPNTKHYLFHRIYQVGKLPFALNLIHFKCSIG